MDGEENHFRLLLQFGWYFFDFLNNIPVSVILEAYSYSR